MADYIAQYLDLVIVDGVMLEDPRLDVLLRSMSPEEVQQAKETIALEYPRRLATPERPQA